MRTITNNHWRQFRYRYEVPDDVLESDFDWTTEDDIDGFFRYLGVWYHLSEFLLAGIDGWDGICAGSYFRGVVIKLSEDGEEYKVGLALS